MQDRLEVRVQAMRYEAEAVLSLELAPLDGGLLPKFEAGAHIDLNLSERMARSYSIISDPGAPSRCYQIGIYYDPNTRGASKYVHDSLRPAQCLTISRPRNTFPLTETATSTVFIAGGIGVTPFIAMSARLNHLGRRWTLYYAARTRRKAAFLDRLEDLLAPGLGTLVTHFDDERQGIFLDVPQFVASAPAGTEFYCCGPSPMMKVFKMACARLPEAQVHLEYFVADTSSPPVNTDGFTVVLAKSNRSFFVPPGETILNVLMNNNIDVAFSCEQGICGACQTRVLAGQPDHRDQFLSAAEKAQSNTIMVCCSGSLSSELVLDL
jgi:vanillate O-demethylase ferredoxin subunit